MGCLSSATITAIKAEIAKLDAEIAALDTAILSAITNSEIEEYSFSSGDGSQRTKRRSLKELDDMRDSLESRRARLYNRLSNTGIVNMNLRRRRYSYGRYFRR